MPRSKPRPPVRSIATESTTPNSLFPGVDGAFLGEDGAIVNSKELQLFPIGHGQSGVRPSFGMNPLQRERPPLGLGNLYPQISRGRGRHQFNQAHAR